MTLVEVLADPTRKAAVVADAVKLVESEVASKRGMSGLALKAGFKTFRKIKPGIMGQALNMLLPDFAPAVDPHFAKAREAGDVESYFRTNGGAVAESLLAVTDGKAERAKHRVMKRVYKSLRPSAREHVVAAMPGLASLISKHVP